MSEVVSNQINCVSNDSDEEVDPIIDIIDYLVRCAKISFKNARLNESEVRTSEKIRIAHELYQLSASNFLTQFGKYLAPHHMQYFENLKISKDSEGEKLANCIKELKQFHSEATRHKRTRNRRYKALKKLQEESSYFSEKEMMYRNPLLYEQLIGQYLTDDEIRQRDGADADNLTLLNMILETVDRSDMREKKNIQELIEGSETDSGFYQNDQNTKMKTTKWGEFDTPETEMNPNKEKIKQSYISAPERKLLREEFLQEMYSSFIEGRDFDFDYNSIDNDEQFDDLELLSQDEEDKYFDSEPTYVENLEAHMKLVEVYGKKSSNDNDTVDPLDIFMKHLNKRKNY